MITTQRVLLGVLALATLILVLPLSDEATAQEACTPPCRSGYLCGPYGVCISACNPPCEPSERCVGRDDEVRCEAKTGAPLSPGVTPVYPSAPQSPIIIDASSLQRESVAGAFFLSLLVPGGGHYLIGEVGAGVGYTLGFLAGSGVSFALLLDYDTMPVGIPLLIISSTIPLISAIHAAVDAADINAERKEQRCQRYPETCTYSGLSFQGLTYTPTQTWRSTEHHVGASFSF